jgi:hypothetical protein
LLHFGGRKEAATFFEAEFGELFANSRQADVVKLGKLGFGHHIFEGIFGLFQFNFQLGFQWFFLVG